MASHGEKVIVLELVASQILVTAKELKGGNIPRPSQYISSLMLFAILGGIAALGPGPASACAALGGVILITLVVSEKGVSILGIFKVGTGQGAKILPFPKYGSPNGVNGGLGAPIAGMDPKVLGGQPATNGPTNLNPGAPAPTQA